MQVSARADYALRAAAELARAAADGKGPLKGDRISKEQGIPKKFMENILLDLKHSGIVRTQRGAAGGYWSKARSPPRSEISPRTPKPGYIIDSCQLSAVSHQLRRRLVRHSSRVLARLSLGPGIEFMASRREVWATVVGSGEQPVVAKTTR
ncbi:MAG: Rrf2 family transcriptional regulator [Actinobacteria bacterium]|nr:Rrf2 family transcriptional regulator [Actinomycetota bacterium]